MNLTTKLVHKVAKSIWLTAFATVGGVVSFGVFIREWLATQDPSVTALVVFILGTFLFLLFGFYSLKIREDNTNLEDIAQNFRSINTIYRDALAQCFAGEPIRDRSQLMAIEKDTINSVCQRISQIYAKLIGKDCLVTVKVLTRENNRLYATTYARSLQNSDRDKANPTKFVVDEGMNTAFDQALMKDSTGGSPHFYSADLRKHSDYKNERQDYLKRYQSTIVVPIRKMPSTTDDGGDIGFLTVDTKSRHRLNNGHHLIMLLALSDQMYNFFNLMRGKYRVEVGGDQ